MSIRLSERAVDFSLKWYYSPLPDIFVPKRFLTEDNEVKNSITGMLDDSLEEFF